MSKTALVTLSNAAPGARYIHAVDGAVTIQPGATVGPVEVAEAELSELPAGVTASAAPEPVAFDAIEGGSAPDTIEAAAGADFDSDLIHLTKAQLLAVAASEGIEVESDANKAAIGAAIVAAREARAAA